MLIHLANESTSVIADLSTGVPTIRHWGRRLADLADLDAVVAASSRPVAGGALDTEAPLSLVPEHGSGFPGRPGLAGHRRRGTAWAPRFSPETHSLIGNTLTAAAIDPIAELRITSTLALADVLSIRLTVDNLSGTERYLLDRLDITLPLPAHARELIQFGGRWTREMHPHRTVFDSGAHTAENRGGRTSHEHPPLLFAGTTSVAEWHGEAWGFHLAWSGNHHWLAEVLPDGRRYVQLGELLHPGEISLRPGEHYSSPEVIAVHSPDGLTPATWAFHRSVRSRVGISTPRPVLLNTWEAVYFDHDVARLKQLADVAAGVGIERFVLDDGWFGSRRDDTSGLGDWSVSPDRYPDGLEPLIDHVLGLGMEFGIWVEPEMTNPDSDLFRAHPDWALQTDGYEPVLGRHQLVLNLGDPAAFEHILGALDSLLRDHDIAFVKWDMNRALVQGSGRHGASGAHEQTLALYRLLDELRARHPTVEIESCSSGGGRIDHEILSRTKRVWTSDCNDPLERQVIQRGVSMFVPPEVMGAHIGPPRSHTTGRRHSLAFRGATALFGHLGVEWNLLKLDAAELDALREIIAIHKRFRSLLHGGDTVRFDSGDDTVVAHGVYASDRSEAVVSMARIATGAALVPATLRLPGLDPDAEYRIRRVGLPDDEREAGPGRTRPTWMTDGAQLSGRDLAVTGLQLPVMNPESAIIAHLHRV